ncbi:helix-hairpin-helix domain-containing protein [Ramlibacter sp. AW1]|uniref:Helix-hairpin-helix domain-containing protein n=1 Tax=Ramlibacter aurantiacus TaxID=2801330 RepID=A0A936ZMY5_9BURK|nr:helix-hairpin-helix domain-containing protein [Ramlibacter aurantiacus]MBL0420258.1 helix-hairpin-helix domain-containing protein [Ramlibacter aurantiacus]
MLKRIIVAGAALLCVAAFAAVDVNKASEAELDAVKGLGPATTKLILDQRKSGTFKNWDDLIARVNGIGPARAARLSSEGLTVGGDPFKAPGATKLKPDPTKEPKK